MTSQKAETMKAVLWEGKPYHMSVAVVPRPTIVEPRDAIVQITTAAICGSDLHDYHGVLGGRDAPFQMGHEAVGIVHAVGSLVTKFKIGDRVVVPDIFVEGSSELIYGEGDLLGTNIGGCQAEYVKAPQADSILFPIPAGTEHELDYLLCSDIFPTAWQSVTGSGFQAGDSIAIYGAGPVGLLAAYSALLRGAVRVYSIDHVDARLNRAESIGAIPIDMRNGDPSSQILKMEPAGVTRGCDCVGFECVNPDGKKQEDYIFNDIMKTVAVGGGVNFTGVYWHGLRDKGEPLQGPKFRSISFDVSTWWNKGISINGGAVVPAAIAPRLIEMITAGRARPSFVIDHHISIDEAPEAYRLFSEHKVQKAVIDFTTKKGRKRKHTNGGL